MRKSVWAGVEYEMGSGATKGQISHSLQIMVKLWVFNMEVIQCHLHFKIITLAFV